ncbi:MAG: 2-oxoacid:acceptor oxidoreductase family protein [bacterium]
MRTEIRFSGLGGQGIILSGLLTGKAASLYDNKNATMTQSFGPEARGSACSAQLVVSDERVLYPYIGRPDILVAMSQDACDRFLPDLIDDGTLLVDEDLVSVNSMRPEFKRYAIPATRFGEQLGNRMVANLVMLGFFTAVTELLSREAFLKAIPGSVPERYLDLNLKAFDRGYTFGLERREKEKTTAHRSVPDTGEPTVAS